MLRNSLDSLIVKFHAVLCSARWYLCRKSCVIVLMDYTSI